MYGQQVFVRRHGFAWRSEALVYLDASTDSGGYYYGDATLELEPVTRVELVFPEADIPRLEALADGDISSLVWRWVNEAWGCPAGRTPEEVGPREGVIDPTELDYPRLLVGARPTRSRQPVAIWLHLHHPRRLHLRIHGLGRRFRAQRVNRDLPRLHPHRPGWE